MITGCLEPVLLRNSETSLTGVLTRSKTHGPDKRIQSKPVFLDKSCWFAVKNWCDFGFHLLPELARTSETTCHLPPNRTTQASEKQR